MDSAIKSILSQEINSKLFELIVIDNGSEDQTSDIVAKWRSQYSNIYYYYEHEPGLHRGRHRGLVEARGDVLVFVDDDIEATSTWLRTIWSIFSDPSVAMAGGNNIPLYLDTPPRWLRALWSRKSHDGARAVNALSIQERPPGRYPIDPFYVWGCNFSIRKSVLYAAGGFHPDGMPPGMIAFRGDGETHVSKYVMDKGLKCIFDSDATVFHKVSPERMTASYFRKRAFNQGISDSYTQLRSPRAPVFWTTLIQATKSFIQFGLYIGKLIRNCVTMDFALLNVLSQEYIGYNEGFAYHQAAYRDDSIVREWVHLKNYL